MDCIDCVETVARLHLYIDRELSSEEITLVRQHLVNCPDCDCRFHFDMSVKRLIHERCAMEHAPEHLRATVLRLAHSKPGTHNELDPEVELEMKAELEG